MVCGKFQSVGILLLLASFNAVVDGLDMTITKPMIDDEYSGEFEFTFTMDKNPSYTGIDIYLMKKRSFSIVSTIRKNHPITETSLTFTPPESVYGDFWIATTVAGRLSIKGYGPSPNGGSWGAKTFTILESKCVDKADPHGSCGEDDYCDNTGTCYICASCLQHQDSFDNFCPAKCGGKSTYEVGDTIPNVTEAEASGPVRDVVRMGCARYNSLVEMTDDEHVIFEASNMMTKRLHDKLTILVAAMQSSDELKQFKLVVQSAYESATDDLTDVTLHHEGRAARISLDGEPTTDQMVLFFIKAKLANFDWIHFMSDFVLHVSVVQDLCTAPVDLMYLLDGSGSIEMTSYGGKPNTFRDKVLGFVNETVGYFDIGEGKKESRFGVAVFSNSAEVEIPLDNGYTSDELREAIYNIDYPGSSTRTTMGLNLVRSELMQELRPLSDGVSRVLIVMTDGLSSDGDPTDASLAIQDDNVNVFAMGVGSSLSLDQLEGIASSKSNVYILKSFDRILDVVAAISSKACDAPAVLTAGEQTDTSVGDCEIKYFSPSCGVVEGADLRITIAQVTGSVEVYISSTSTHPGPFDYEVKDTTDDLTKILFIRLQEGQTSANIIIGVKGTSEGTNEFTLDAWSDIFEGISSSTSTVSEATAVDTVVYTPPVSSDSTASREYYIEKGNTDSDFSIDETTGKIVIAHALDYERTTFYNLRVMGNTEGQPCLNGFTDVHINVGNENDNKPEINGGKDREGNFIALPFSVSLDEDTPINTLVWTISASDPDNVAKGSLKFSLLMKRRGRAVRELSQPTFRINQDGAIYTNAKLDYETQDTYTMEVSVSDEGNPPLTASTSATIVIAAVYCPVGTSSETGTAPCTVQRDCYATEFEEKPMTTTTNRLCTTLTTPCTIGDTYETTSPTLTSDRVCTPQLVCETDEYESVEPTYTTLRECAPADTCDEDEFESSPLKALVDRECTPYTVCDGVTKYVWKAGGDDFDLQCRTARVCIPGVEYESRSPSEFTNRECTVIDVCATNGTEYESTSPDAVTNRVCSPVTPTCDYDTHFEALAPTDVSNRVCTQLQECTPTSHYETSAPTETSDRVCTALRVCTSAEFESSAPAPLSKPVSNRQCTSTRVCEVTEFQTVDDTPTSDRQCQEHAPKCTVGTTFQTVAPTTLVDRVCKAVSACDVMATEFVARPATEFSDIECADATVCADAEFESVALTTDGNRQCVTTTVCSDEPKEHETVAPTTTSDRVCKETGMCSSIEFETAAPTDTTDRECALLKVCDAKSEFESSPADATTNRECTALTVCSVTVSNTFRTVLPSPTSDRKCEPVKSCLDEEYETDEPTDVSNRVCKELTTCSDKEFQTAAPTDFSNRQCSPLLFCAVGDEFEKLAPTATTNRVCQGFSQCETDEFESVAVTDTSDRICTAALVCLTTEFETTALTTTTNRECQALTTCENAEHETSAANPTTNRICTVNKICADDQHETQQPGKFTDRVCTDNTVCAEVGVEFEASAATSFVNRVCLPVNQCEDGQYEKTPATATTDTSCLALTVCSEFEFESTTPSYSVNRECKAFTICLFNQFESTPATPTSDLSCTDVTDCKVDIEFQVLDSTATSNRQCSPVTECTDDEYESTAPTLLANRDCTALTTCAALQFESKAPTDTSNRECTDLTQCTSAEFLATSGTKYSNAVCEPIKDCGAVGVEYLETAYTTTSNNVCAAVTQCTSEQFQATQPTATSDASCTSITQCLASESMEELDAPTATSDRTCQELCETERDADGTCPVGTLLTQNSTAEATGTVSTMVIAGVLVAILMIILLVVAIYKMPRRKKNQKDAVEARSLIEGDDDFNPMFVTQHNPSNAIAMMATLSSPAALTKRGDRLWTEFRRCIAFDEMYFGNQPLLLKDTALEDIYALLAVTCPPRSFFANLREVGTRFMIQEIDTADPDSVVLDDVVDYFARAMPDVIIERAIDMLAVLAISGSDFPEEEINETFYAMIDDYVPDENHYLSPSIDGRRMGAYAATRELHQVDPIYYEVDDEKESEYELVSEYAIGGSMEIDREPVYHMSGLDDDEDEDTGYSDFTKPGDEDTYSFANSSNGMESTDMDEDIYSLANSNSGVERHGTARHEVEDMYSMANSITIGMGGGDNDTYSTADSGPEQFLYGYNQRYTTASSSPNETDDAEAVYDVGDSTVEVATIKARTLKQKQGGEQLYDTADPQDYRSGGADDTIYDTAASEDVDYKDRAPQKYNVYGQAASDVISPDLVYDTATSRDENGIAAGDVGYKDRAPQKYNAYGQAIGLAEQAIYDTGNSPDAPECAIYDTGNSPDAPGECAIYDTGNSAVNPLTYDTANSAVKRAPTMQYDTADGVAQHGGHQIYDIGNDEEPLYATADTEEHGHGTARRRNSTQRANNSGMRVNNAYDLGQTTTTKEQMYDIGNTKPQVYDVGNTKPQIYDVPSAQVYDMGDAVCSQEDAIYDNNNMENSMPAEIEDDIYDNVTTSKTGTIMKDAPGKVMIDMFPDDNEDDEASTLLAVGRNDTMKSITSADIHAMESDFMAMEEDGFTFDPDTMERSPSAGNMDTLKSNTDSPYMAVGGYLKVEGEPTQL